MKVLTYLIIAYFILNVITFFVALKAYFERRFLNYKNLVQSKVLRNLLIYNTILLLFESYYILEVLYNKGLVKFDVPLKAKIFYNCRGIVMPFLVCLEPSIRREFKSVLCCRRKNLSKSRTFDIQESKLQDTNLIFLCSSQNNLLVSGIINGIHICLS